MCFHFLCNSGSKTFLIVRIERDMIVNARKIPVIVVQVECNLNFLDRFSNNAQISNSMKIRSMRPELFHADRRTLRRCHFSQICRRT
jgi:NurA-like 5'-3' nuclease